MAVTSSSTDAMVSSTTTVQSSSTLSTTVTMSSTISTQSFNGFQSGSNIGSPLDTSSSAYQMLLKQVENLRKENSTLKAELKNNTSHISKLESEASRMKDMVLLLGKPIVGGGLDSNVLQLDHNNPVRYSGTNLPHDDPTLLNSDIGSSAMQGQIHSTFQTPLKLQIGMEQDVKKQRPEFLIGLQQNSFGQQTHKTALAGSVSPSPTTAVAEAMKRNLLLLRTERTGIYRTITVEEQTKDFYLKQLDELRLRLDSVSDSEKFTKPNDKTRQQIETEIANLQKTMEQNLGNSEVMKQRLESRMKQLQDIDKEIRNMEKHIRKLEMTPTSPDIPIFSTNSHIESDADFGSCLKHASFMQGSTGYTVTSTQTPSINSNSEGIIYEEEFSSCDNSALDLQVVAINGKTSRSVQTMASSVACRTMQNSMLNSNISDFPNSGIHSHDSSSSRTDPAVPGSLESLQSQSDIDDTASMHSFTTSLPRHFQSSSIGPQKDGGHSPSFLHANKEDLTRRFLKLSKSVEGCISMRQNGYVPLIIQIIHDESILNLPQCWTVPSTPGRTSVTITNTLKAAKEIRIGMIKTLGNVVHATATPDFPRSKLEIQIFSHLEFIHGYCELLFEFWIYVQTLRKKSDQTKNVHSPGSVEGCLENGINVAENSQDDVNKIYDFKAGVCMVYDPPIPRIRAIMELSHNEAIRSIINDLGGLFVVAELFILHCRCVASSDLVQSYHVGKELTCPNVVLLFALINLTYGDASNKATLIQMPGLIDTVMSQMSLESEEIQQVMARLVRNLSWQPDEKCRDILRQKNIVTVLMKCALKSKRDDTLKSVLSALWNLSGHCPENRTSICSVKGALAFLVSTLTYRTAAIIESGGGILRNVSSVVATNEEYRQILREKNCLQILLTHLKAARLTIVSNACGTLWNLSARNAHDQKLLWDLGAVPMLKNLVHSKHSVIAQGSSAALRNLISNRPGSSTGVASEKSETVKLKARKQRTGDSYENNKNLPETENFSPRHHAWSAAQDKMISPSSVISPQRHSMQETSTSSPVPDAEKSRRFKKGGLQYSGSLGNFPTDFGENFSKSQGSGSKYIGAARNSSSYPDHYSSNTSNNNIAFRNTETSVTNQKRIGKNMAGFAPVGGAGGMLKDVMIFNDNIPQPVQSPGQQVTSMQNTNQPQSNMSLRQYFQLVAAKKASGIQPGGATAEQNPSFIQNNELRNPLNTQNPNIANLHSLKGSPHLQNQCYSFGPSSNHASPGATQKHMSRLPQMHNQLTVPHPQRVQKLMQNPQMQNMNKPPIALVPKCPEDLVRRLHDVEEDYDNDDDPVNYSLQYGDEHMTPGIQSPRTEEIYENAGIVSNGQSARPPRHDANYMHSHMNAPSIPSASMNGPVTQSDGGLSGLSSCIGSTGSSAQQRQDAGMKRLGSSAVSTDLPGPSLERQNPTLPAAYNNLRFEDDLAFEDEKPTNFGAMYSEEQLYEPIQHQSMGMMPFSEVDQPPYSSADTAQNNLNTQQTMTSNNSQSVNEATLEGRELDDKFDTGAITPGHYFNNYKSGRNSGIMTPRTPYEDTPMMFSRGSSSLGSVSDGESIHSSITSEPGSQMYSGRVSPSHLPDSPSQSMPVSPRRSPRPRTPVDPQNNNSHSNRDLRSTMYKSSEDRPNLSSTAILPNDTAQKQPMSKRIEDRLNKIEQPGYVTSLPHKDEVNVYRSEGAMSVMTKFSSLTIDSNDKIHPIANDQGTLSKVQSPTGSKSSSLCHDTDAQSKHSDNVDCSESAVKNDISKDVSHPGPRAVLHAGYITSLPTNDEIKNFVHEGTLSPMTAFSEISCLQEDNQGFQKSTGSVFSVPNSSNSNRAGTRSIASNINSFASRSSATGASVPPPPPGKNPVKEENQEEDAKSSKHPSNFSSVTSPTSHSIEGADEDLEDDSDSLPSSSSDDDDLLQQCIQHGLPKKKSSRSWLKSSARSISSKSSSRSGRSSRSKDKSSHAGSSNASNEEKEKKQEDRRVTNPSPEVVAERKRIDIKKKIESADQKLNGVHIVTYIENLINKSDNPDDVGTPEISHDTSKTKQVIDDAEKLQPSYSVRKKLKENEKQVNLTQRLNSAPSNPPQFRMPKTPAQLPSEPTQPLQSKMRIQSYIREGMTTYVTEGTPIEMSRSTSLSNLTIDSECGDTLDMTELRLLKTSHSVNDIKDSSVEISVNSSNISVPKPASSVPMHVRTASLGGSDRSSPALQDSREILEVLGQQIADLSLSTAESVVKDPGYTTSLPQTDEIRRYDAEGSQCGGTIFSALTIDSETKIAPMVPTDDNFSQQQIPKNTNVEQIESSSIPPSLPTGNGSSQLPRNHWVDERPLERVEVQHQRTNDQLKRNPDLASWDPPPPVEPQYNSQSSHYNNENDNLAMKEEQRKYTIEDTPLYLSGPGSLSSLSFDFGSDDDNELLHACITSALPVDKKNSNPPYPNQLLMMQQQQQQQHALVTDPHARMNHGVPDGKVDSPTANQMPFGIQTLQQHSQSSTLQQISNINSNLPASYIQSPNDEQWSLIERDADAIAAQLRQQSQHHHPQASGQHMSGASYSQDLSQSSSVSLSQPTDGFYRLSRQASMQDSDLSASLSVPDERHSYVVHPNCVTSPHRNASQTCASGLKHHLDKPVNRGKSQNERNIRTGKKLSPTKNKDSNAVRRVRNQPGQAKDSSSGSSSSFRQPRHRHTGNNTRRIEICSCQTPQPRCYNHGPVSASTPHLVDGVKLPNSRPRRKSTNSASKNSVGGYEHMSHHHHHQQKPSRPRNQSKNIYHPSVTQLYPPLKDMVGVLEGVATVAARGDKVVADRNPSQYSGNPGSQPLSKKSSSSSLVRSATFITEKPSQVLLQNMTQEEKEHYTNSSMSSSISPPQSQHSTRSVGNPRTRSPRGSSHSLKAKSRDVVSRGSTHSLKTHSTISKEPAKQKDKKKNLTGTQAKPKHNKVWSGIKKLLSPSDDTTKSLDNSSNKSPTPRKAVQKKDSTKGIKTMNKNSVKNPLSKKQCGVNKLKQSAITKANESGSSLSLSSSSASNASVSDGDVTSSKSSLMQGNVTPYGLLPKSPSVNAIMRRAMSTNIPQSRSTGILDQSRVPKSSAQSVWRRTPPKVASQTPNDKKFEQTPQPRTADGISSNSTKNVLKNQPQLGDHKNAESENIWISKKELVNMKQESLPRLSISSKSKLPISQGQNAVQYIHGAVSEVTGENRKPGPSSPASAGFQSPPRTQSPRVVQQVAPFNYRPSPHRKMTSHSEGIMEKNNHESRKIGPDCKQTSV